MQSNKRLQENFEGDDFEEFCRGALAYLRRHLGPRMQSRFGASDILNSAFKSFVEKYNNGDILLDDTRPIWGLLWKKVKRKLSSVCRWHQANKRSVDREETSDQGAPQVASNDRPDEHLLCLEIINELPEYLQAVALLKLQGKEKEDIAQSCGVRLSTVERWLRELEESISGDL